jgi:O-antigen/teichoic acid export membrane protein
MKSTITQQSNSSAPLAPQLSSQANPHGGGVAGTYIRGSGLLLGGRCLSTHLSLAVQVLTVRFLSKNDYGALSYALGVVSIGSSLVLVGFGKTVSRFVPIYQERDDYARVYGTVILAISTIWGLGLTFGIVLFTARGTISGTIVHDPTALSLLLILALLVPINAFDHILQNLVAIFARPSAIFFRRHVVGPMLRLGAIVLVIAVSGDVFLLAHAILVGSTIGVWLYVYALWQELRRSGILSRFDWRSIKLPVRELFRYSVPLLSSELPVLLRGSVAVILLEYFKSPVAVAEYRAVYPLAGLNLVVFQSFGFLFVPLASRMFARQQDHGINLLYWQTSAWITVLTLPVFLLTCSLARPTTSLVLGESYGNTSAVLAVLALGYYFNAVLGFNADTLRVYGRVRYTTTVDLCAAFMFIGLCVLLIPRYAAMGAAVAATATAIAHNIGNQVGLSIATTGVQPLNWRVGAVFIAAIASTSILFFVESLFAPPVFTSLLLAALASLALIRTARHLVRPTAEFPELLRIPLVRHLLQ